MLNRLLLPVLMLVTCCHIGAAWSWASLGDKQVYLERFAQVRSAIDEGDLLTANRQFSSIEVPYDDYPDWLGEYYLTSAHLMYANDPTNIHAIRMTLGLAQMDLANQTDSAAYAEAWLLQLRLNAADRALDAVMQQVDEVASLALHHDYPPLAVEALVFAADVTLRDGHPLVALERLDEARNIAEQQLTPRLEAELALAYGQFYGKAMMLKRAVSELKHAERFFDQHGPKKRFVDTLIGFANSYLVSGDETKAKAYFLRALTETESSQLSLQRVAATKGLASLYLLEGHSYEARELANDGLANSVAIADQYEFQKLLTKASLEQGDSWSADHNLEQTRAIWNQLPASKKQSLSGIDIWLLNAQLAALKGQSMVSWRYMTQYKHELNEALYRLSSSGIEALTVEKDVERLAAQTAELQDRNAVIQNELKSAQERQQLQMTVNILSAVLLAALLFIGLRIIRDKHKLRQLADLDSLTGICNRRAGTQHCVEWQALHPHQPLALIVFDIDHFKLINDNHGHQTGDSVLRQIAQITKAHCRKSDILARFGGEEFLLALPDSELEGAMHCAEQIRAAFEKALFAKQQQVTASFGVAAASDLSFEKLFERADKALYVAKHTRNRVCPYRPQSSQIPSASESLQQQPEQL